MNKNIDKLIRVEKHIIKKDKNIDYACWLSKNLYNYVNYCIRQSYFNTKTLPKEYELSSKLCKRNQKDFRALPCTVSQQIIRRLYKTWATSFKLIKDYKLNPSKYSNSPSFPKYKKKNGKNIIILTDKVFRIKNGYIHFAKKLNLKPIKTRTSNIKQVHIVPHATCYVIEVIYEKEEKHYENLKKENILAIDLGVNNLATCINNVGERPFIINGKPLKSINQYSNKLKAKYLSFVGNVGISKKLNKIMLKRNNLISNYLHQASRVIINYCLKNNIGTVIIGHNKYWKQDINIGKKNNQNFANIPFNTFIHQIQYKGDDVGIKVIITEENYTSKIDHLLFESLEHHEKYLGKRIKRGLFHSFANKYLNADINGAIGIARKVAGDEFVKDLISRGQALCPFKITL